MGFSIFLTEISFSRISNVDDGKIQHFGGLDDESIKIVVKNVNVNVSRINNDDKCVIFIFLKKSVEGEIFIKSMKSRSMEACRIWWRLKRLLLQNQMLIRFMSMGYYCR